MTPLAVESVGRHDAPAVALLHGWLGDRRDWDEVVAALGDAGRLRLLRVELPGHGASPPAAPGGLPAAAAALWAALDAVGVGRVALVGYSMGGRLALTAALLAPARCTGIAVIAASPGIDDAAARVARAGLDDARADELLRLGLPRFVQDWYAQPLFQGLAGDAAARAALGARREDGDAVAIAATLRALSVGRQPPLAARLAELPPGSEWVAGELDSAYAELARRSAAASPEGRVTIVPGCSHALLQEAPAAVAAAIAAVAGFDRGG